MIIKHVKRDLLTVDPKKSVYAHCVAVDGAMGAGIAKTLTETYPNLRGLFRYQNPKLGDAIRVETDGAIIYNLVTKTESRQKPINHDAMAFALQNMKRQMLEHDEKYVAMPLIGAGLDRLNWDKTQDVIINIFKNTNIGIGVCHLDDSHKYKNIQINTSLENQNDKGYVLALTGHRPHDFEVGNGKPYDMNHPVYKSLYNELRQYAETKYKEHGKITIISGMALGADTIWANVAVDMKREYGANNIRLEAHSPIESHDGKWPKHSKDNYRNLLAEADEVVYYAPNYNPYSMQLRNIGMIDKCDELVAAYNGYKVQNSGTYNAIKYAREQDKQIYYTDTSYFKADSDFLKALSQYENTQQNTVER